MTLLEWVRVGAGAGADGDDGGKYRCRGDDACTGILGPGVVAANQTQRDDVPTSCCRHPRRVLQHGQPGIVHCVLKRRSGILAAALVWKGAACRVLQVHGLGLLSNWRGPHLVEKAVVQLERITALDFRGWPRARSTGEALGT
jgi:hypothetical protein